MFKIQTIKFSIKQAIKVILFLFAVTTSQFCYSEDTKAAGKHYEKAVMEFHNGNLENAILELKNSLKQKPDFLAAQILLAKVHLKNNNLISAEVALSKADKLGADPELLVRVKAQLYLKQLKYEHVLKEIIPAKYSKPMQADLHIYRGDAYLQIDENGYALNEYDTAAKMQPDRIEPLVGRATILLRLEKIDEAIKTAKKAAAMAPNSAASWYINGSISHALGRLEQALIDYGKVLDIESEHHDALIARAGVLMDLKRDDEAEKDLLMLREAFPYDARASYLHGVLLARNNRQEEATEALASASESLDVIKPEYIEKHAQSLMLSSLVNYSLKRFDMAQSTLNKYTLKYPNQIGAAKLLGSILLNKGEYDQVIKLLKPKLSKAANDYRLLFILGNAYMQNGQHDMANIMLEKASKLEIKGIDLDTELGLNRLGMGQNSLAIESLEQAIKNNPENIKAGIPLTIIYLNTRQAKKAFDVVSKLYQQSPDNLTLLNLLGTTQIGIGNRALARESFNKAVNQDPGFMTAHLNLTKLDLLENKPESAKQRLIKQVALNTENIALLIELAKIYMSEANYVEASKSLDSASIIDSNSRSVNIAKIELNLKTGRYPKALDMAQKLNKEDRNDMQIMDLLAQCYLVNGNKSKASAVLVNMSNKAGFNTKQLYRIAQKQFAINDYSGAIKSLKNVILVNENHIPARIALSEVELKQGETFFAKKHADFLMENFPDQPFGYRLLGDITNKEKNNTKSIEYYRQAFDKLQNTYYLMRLYSSVKQYGDKQEAFELVKKWVSNHPNDLIPVQALAEEHLSAKRFKLAQKYYEQLIKQYNNRPDLLNNLAYIYFAIEDDRALGFAQKAQQLAPDQAAANDTLGWILVNSGQVEQGLRYLRNAHARSSQDPEIRYHIAKALTLLNRDQEAKVELKKALQKNQAFHGKDEAEKLLKSLEL